MTTIIKNGTVVIDIANAFPADDRVPIIVPEVNLGDLRKQTKIIVSPTAISIQLAVALAPIHKTNPIKRVLVSTYESVSGSGAVAVAYPGDRRQGQTDEGRRPRRGRVRGWGAGL